jgi:hypothetical protein
MRRVEKQLLRRRRQDHVGIENVEGDVAPAGTFRPQAVRQVRCAREGLAEQQTSPAAIECDIALQLALR